MANYPFESLNAPTTAHDKEAPEMDRISEFVHRDAEQPYLLVVASRQPHTPWNKGEVRYEPAKLTVPADLVDTPETRQALANYYREVSDFDRELGEVLAVIDESGQADDTLVIYTSEQGAMFPGGKWTLYDGGIRTAFVARWPGVVGPSSSTDALVAYVDVVPTLVELAGGAVADLDGRSFAAVLRGDESAHREYVFGVHTNTGVCNGVPYPIRSARDSRYKLIVNGHHDQTFRNNITERDPADYFASWRVLAESGDKHARQRVAAYQRRAHVEFYDLENDPWEMHNLAADPAYRPELDRLQNVLGNWQASQGDVEMQATEARAKYRILLPGLAKLSTSKCKPRD
jgi:uncharacterized sulfatase